MENSLATRSNPATALFGSVYSLDEISELVGVSRRTLCRRLTRAQEVAANHLVQLQREDTKAWAA